VIWTLDRQKFFFTSNSAVSAFTAAADAAAEKIKSGEVVVGTTVE
jgi:hypothetical protein